MCAQVNTLIRKFGMCSVKGKTQLFEAYCNPMYTAHLWRRYRRSSMQKLTVAYKDGMMMLLKVPQWSSASQLLISDSVPTCSAVLRDLMYRTLWTSFSQWPTLFRAQSDSLQRRFGLFAIDDIDMFLHMYIWFVFFCFVFVSLGTRIIGIRLTVLFANLETMCGRAVTFNLHMSRPVWAQQRWLVEGRNTFCSYIADEKKKIRDQGFWMLIS